jgi:hypothetical protein
MIIKPADLIVTRISTKRLCRCLATFDHQSAAKPARRHAKQAKMTSLLAQRRLKPTPLSDHSD